MCVVLLVVCVRVCLGRYETVQAHCEDANAQVEDLSAELGARTTAAAVASIDPCYPCYRYHIAPKPITAPKASMCAD